MATGTRHTAATRRTEPKSADAPEPQLTAADAPGMPIRSRLQSRQRPQSKCELGVYFYLCGDYEDPANGIESLVNRMREQAEAITAAPLDPQIGVAIQLDGITGPGGRKVARRWARNGSSDPTDDWEDIGPINTGSEKEFENFLVWADQICPARRVVLMIAGMGIFENSHALSGERWSHLFSICDDSSNRDSMDLVDFGAALRQFVRQRWQQPAIRAKARRRARASTPKIEDAAYSSEDETQRPEERKIDVIAFDMGDIQCFELALELEGSAQVVVAPQRRAIPGGWNYRALLEDWSIALRDRRSDSRSLGEILVKQAMQQPALPWAGPAASAPADPNSKDPISAVDLDCMGPLSSTFDEFTVALTTNLGDELVWRMRSDTLRALWQGDPAGRPANGHSYAPYDVGEMLLTISNHAGRDAERPVTVWLEIKLFSIVFSSRRQQSPWFPELRDAIVRRLVERRDPTLPDPDRIWTILTRAAPTEDAKRGEEAAELHFFMCEDGQKPDAVHERMFEALLREAVEDVLDVLPPDLREEYLRLDIPRRQLRRIADLADNARRFLQPDRVSPGGTSFVIAVSNEAQRADTPTLPCGLWIFRPAHVDELRDLTYLSLRFHDRVHWAAYLTAVGLIRMHPIALWRLVASMLSSSNPFARAEIQRLITGPNAELIGFRKQLRVLSAPSSASITIDEREETTRPGRNGNESPPAKQERKKKYFWIRLASHMPGATIPEQRSRVQEQTFERAVEILERILDKPRLDAADVQQFHAVGAALGADVFQDLRPALRAIEEKWAEASRCCNLCDFEPAHLQIQVPQELMRFPWELLNDGTRWLCSRFAIGRSGDRPLSMPRSGGARAHGMPAGCVCW